MSSSTPPFFPTSPTQRYGLRNEEHGLHIFMGFYDNAFRTAKEIFEAQDLDWEDMFLADSDVTIAVRARFNMST